jgi:hypothetical protein
VSISRDARVGSEKAEKKETRVFFSMIAELNPE